ncbi:MAG: efflux transporter outer membrane subunit [Zoogloeaceae bacterium]|nr:efflux transporter outer membrane subunit [Zoogloeaceae bacterium]
MFHRPLLAATLFLLSGCALGPDFLRPKITPLPVYHEAPADWKFAAQSLQSSPDHQPALAPDWWKIFDDAELDQLVETANAANQDIAAAAASYRQAVAALGVNRAGLFPGVDIGLARNRGAQDGGAISRSNRLTLDIGWEVDLWGRIRRGIEAGENTAAASAADLAAMRLSIQAALVQDYLQLRVNDIHQRLLESTLEAWQRSLDITRNRYQAGVVSQADVAQAETQYESTRAQLIDLGIQRAQLEHALALLQGKIPGSVQLAPRDKGDQETPKLPEIPPALPSTLLENRPDIIAAERHVAAANAEIGVAQAVFFPVLNLGASGGYQSASFANLVSAPHRFWSLGPALALTLFDGGRRSSRKEQAIAAYDQRVANYRQTVLTAFQEVEDSLAALSILAAEQAVQARAARAASEFQTLTRNQYLAGTVSYLNVATAQTAALSAERASLELLNRQLQTAVTLVKALGGGGWRHHGRPPES